MEHKNIYWNMYADIWAYHQKYINSLQDDDKFWHRLVEDGRTVARKYNNNRFINNLVVNEMAEFENVYEKKHKQDMPL